MSLFKYAGLYRGHPQEPDPQQHGVDDDPEGADNGRRVCGDGGGNEHVGDHQHLHRFRSYHHGK